MKESRNLNLDLLRFMGVLIIMVAHASPPGWLFQLRNFGTPLLVVASALTYSYIYSNKKINIIPFYKKRLKRLVFPAWIFLSVFFLLFFLYKNQLNQQFPWTTENIISSYTFMGSILGIWIFKIYILLALITPYVIAFNKKIFSDFFYYIFLLLMYVLYELSVFFISPYISGSTVQIFNGIVFIIFPYSILYAYGVRLGKLTDIQLMVVAAVSLTLFLSLAFWKYSITNHFVPTQLYKYPPTLYYLSYAFVAIHLIYLTIRKVNISNHWIREIVLFLSENSLWIYLWHIFAYYLWNEFNILVSNHSFLLFLLKTFFLLAFGVICTIIQKYLVKKYIPQTTVFHKQLSSLLT